MLLFQRRNGTDSAVMAIESAATVVTTFSGAIVANNTIASTKMNLHFSLTYGLLYDEELALDSCESFDTVLCARDIVFTVEGDTVLIGYPRGFDGEHHAWF